MNRCTICGSTEWMDLASAATPAGICGICADALDSLRVVYADVGPVEAFWMAVNGCEVGVRRYVGDRVRTAGRTAVEQVPRARTADSGRPF